MCTVHEVSPPNPVELGHILSASGSSRCLFTLRADHAVPDLDKTHREQLLKVFQYSNSTKAAGLSARQIFRMARRLAAFPDTDLCLDAQRSALVDFMPALARDVFMQGLSKSGLATHSRPADEASKITVLQEERLVDIAGVRLPIRADTNPTLVPRTVFYDNPQHTRIMRDMAKDLQLGSSVIRTESYLTQETTCYSSVTKAWARTRWSTGCYNCLIYHASTYSCIVTRQVPPRSPKRN